MAVTGTMKNWDYHYGPDAPLFLPGQDMVKGDLVDILLTPPFSLAQSERFAVYTNIARNTKEGKANCLEAGAAGRIPITVDLYDQATRVRDALLADPEIGEILEALDPDHSQQPHFWTDAAGRPCRCLPDIVTYDGRLYDLKKTKSAVPRRFYWQAKDLAYDLQMAHLALGHEDKHGTPPVEVGIIAFEWDPPFDCSLLILDQEDIDVGLDRRELAFMRIAECQQSGQWPSHGRQPFRTTSRYSLEES
jgi:hypothetical protein